MKILLVEDDDGVRNTIREVLMDNEHRVEDVRSAEEALLKLPGDYNLIISDILLDKMTGISLLETVSQMEPTIPVIMITGFGGAEIEEECRKKGARGFLRKPFSVHKLFSLVEEAGKKPH
jgi:DNA-binding NtrC family response regulator